MGKECERCVVIPLVGGSNGNRMLEVLSVRLLRDLVRVNLNLEATCHSKFQVLEYLIQKLLKSNMIYRL